MTGFVSAIERLSQNPALCTQMGLSGREFILRNLTKEVGTGKYVEVIRNVNVNVNLNLNEKNDGM